VRQREQNEPIEDMYPNKRAPVVVLQNGEHVVREDMLWGFPKSPTMSGPRRYPWRWSSPDLRGVGNPVVDQHRVADGPRARVVLAPGTRYSALSLEPR